MASTASHAQSRRALPALIALVALLVLTALVWWRVLNRSDTGATATLKPCPTPTVKVITLPAPSSIYLQVLNSTTRNGIAGKARTVLSNIGFQIPGAAADDTKKFLNKIKATAQIRYGTTSAPAARLVRYYLPGATLVPTRTATTTIVVSLGTRYRGIASAASVRAALKRDGAVAGTPTPTAGVSPTCASPSGTASTSGTSSTSASAGSSTSG